ncbi:acyltransferase [Pseudoclavibacter sp. Marseille-Q4354]|nr:acyltransferase [Pseudoclavibacter sp. Marseille-Q4354]
MPTFRSALGQRDNALNFVRLVLASAVIFGHAWPIGGFSSSAFSWLGEWAVCGFFAISGYLIAGSRMRLPLGTFLVHRTLRIYPAFWVCLVVVALVLAPLSTLLTRESYVFSSGLSYIWKNFSLFVTQYGIQETLMSVPFPGTWNAPLWTLKYEFAAYLAAGLVLTVPFARRKPITTTAVLLATVTLGYVLSADYFGITTDLVVNGSRLGTFFLAGMLLYFLGDRLRLNWTVFLTAVSVLAGAVILGLDSWLGPVPFAFIVLWVGAKLPVRIGARNDMSYGVYIWAWPVQQYLAIIDTSAMGPWLSGALALALTLPLAWCSWRLIEKPCMGLRKVMRKVQAPQARPSPVP